MSFPSPVTLPENLKAEIDYLVKNGAPVPSLVVENVDFPGAPSPAYEVVALVFSKNGFPDYKAEIPPFGATDQSVTSALAELMARGMVVGNPAAVPPYVPPSKPVPLPPTPVDAFVGIPDAAHPGLFCPGAACTPQFMMALSVADKSWPAADGNKYKPVLVNPTSMFANWEWTKAA